MLAENLIAVTVLTVGFPRHHKTTVGQTSNGRRCLVTCRIAIDLKLAADRSARCIVTLAENSMDVAVLTVGFPRHHKTAVRHCGDGRFGLAGLRIGIDLKLTTGRSAGCIVTLAENPVSVAVLKPG